jgi:hypothetical protein
MALRATLELFLAVLLQAQSTGSDSKTLQPNPAAAIPEAPPFVTCPAGAPIGAVDLQVRAGDQRLPFRTINHLSEGDILLYAPLLRGKEKRPGEVALVLVPEKRIPGDPSILVTDPVRADKPHEWKMTQTISLAALVYGPAGLSRRKVSKFLSQDEVLVAQLADYADKTAQAEQLVATLSNAQSSSASVNAALNGFASTYGFAVQIDRNAPTQAQAATLFATMNPQLASYNPLSSSAQTVGQTTSLATIAGSLFFGTPIGLAAGGTAMLLDLRAIAFPDTQFRASFAQPVAASKTAVNLCGQQGPLPPHTRAAYIWANRVPNVPPPAIHIGDANFIPPNQRTPVPIEVGGAAWKYVDRAREWTLVGNQKKYPISAVKLGNPQALELDLTQANPPEGDYKLTGVWDWTPFEATGTVHVVPLDDFTKVHLDPASQDRVLAKSGKIPVTLRGGDFEFATKIELQKTNDEFATPETVRFLLPKGLRKGPQDHLDAQLDTEHLDPGSYQLLISQQDGKSHRVDFKVLTNPPRIDNLPILINQGVSTQHFVLKGERLEQVSRLEAPGVVFDLSPPGVNQTERSVTVELKSSPQPGTPLPVTAHLKDRNEPLELSGGLEITGPLPVIASSKLSLPKGFAIQVRSNEFPAGYTLSAMLDVKNIERQSVLQLACADGVGTPVSLHLGEQSRDRNLQQLSADQLFLAIETDRLPAGCSLQAVIDNGRGGRSKPFTMAQIVRLPQIDTFVLADADPPGGTHQYEIRGQNLEMIEKLGWEKSIGVPVPALPTPLSGPGLKQSIQVGLPEPVRDASLYIWLRGDQEGRETGIKPPARPTPAMVQTATSRDATHAGSTSPVLAHTVEKRVTTATISASPNPSTAGESVTFTAAVAVTSSSGTIALAGTVSFVAGETALGRATLDDKGTATFSTSALSAGKYDVKAVYTGSEAFAESTSATISLVVQ